MQRDFDRQQYLAWIEAVYQLLHARFGGDAEQGGGERFYGELRVGHHMQSQLGDVQFQVSIASDLLRRVRRVGPIEWRAISPANAAEEIFTAYDRLKSEH